MSDIAERVKKIVVEHLGVDAAKVTDNASFIDDLGADSLDTVELVMAFEEEFSVEIPDDAAEKIATVKDAIEFHQQQKSCGLSRVFVLRIRSGDNIRCAVLLSLAWESCRLWGSVWTSTGKRLISLVASGIGRITHFDPVRNDLSGRGAGSTRKWPEGELNLDAYIEPKEQKKMDNFIHFAVAAAADEAIKDGGYKPETDEQRDRIGVMIGSGIGGLNEIYETSILLHERGPQTRVAFLYPAQFNQPGIGPDIDNAWLSRPQSFSGDGLCHRRACDRRCRAADRAG